jgi:branched-chain amino acid transport system permease protein
MIDPLVLQFGPTELIEVFIRGMGTAGVFVLIASGLSLIFGLMGVLNFAHGSLTTYGAFAGAALLLSISTPETGGPTAVVVLLATAVGVFVLLSLFGASIEFGLIRRLYERPPIDQILLTFGVALVLDEFLTIVLELWNVDPFRPYATPASYGPGFLAEGQNLILGGVEVRWLYIFEFVVGALVVAAVWLFLTRTRYGLYIRAGSEDDEMAEALGINVRRVFTLVFGVGIGLAGVSGLFLIWDPVYKLQITLGAEALLPAFIVVVVGGLGTFKGTVVASGVAGIFAQFGNALFTNQTQIGGVNFGDFAQLPSMLIFILLIVMLIVRPTGLYGEEEVGGH